MILLKRIEKVVTIIWLRNNLRNIGTEILKSKIFEKSE